MSNTLRWVHPSISQSHSKNVRRDRKPAKKNWRFNKYCRNTLYNLREKISQLRLKESIGV